MENNPPGFLAPTPEYIKELYLKKQLGEYGRLLSLQPEFDWDLITELNLSSSNMVEIVGLRLLRNLKDLRMVQNSIRKIENLHWLTKIEHLDLSYNKIAKIENLECLTALRFLGLRHNRVTVLENLDANVLLDTLLVAGNAITDVGRAVSYARRFLPALRRLDVSEDGPAADPSAPSSAVVDAERRGGGGRFIDELYAADQAGRLLSRWNSTVRSAFNVYARGVEELAAQLRRTISDRLGARDDMSRAFMRNYCKLVRSSTERSRERIREFEETRWARTSTQSLVISGSGKDRWSANGSRGESVDRLSSASDMEISFTESDVDALADRLLVNNIKANRSISTIIETYENVLQEEIKATSDLLVPIFFNMREAENAYAQVLTENVKLVVNNTQKLIPKKFLNKFESRHAILPAAYQSIDKHLDMIHKYEEKVNSDNNSWMTNTIDELKNTEKKRFWMVIEEVIKYREEYLTSIGT